MPSDHTVSWDAPALPATQPDMPPWLREQIAELQASVAYWRNIRDNCAAESNAGAWRATVQRLAVAETMLAAATSR